MHGEQHDEPEEVVALDGIERANVPPGGQQDGASERQHLLGGSLPIESGERIGLDDVEVVGSEVRFRKAPGAPDNATVIKEKHFVGEAFDVHEHVGADEERDAFGLEGAEELEDGFAGGGVEAFEGFIEDEEFGSGEERHGEGGLLAHAIGRGGGEPVGGFVEVEELQQFG